MSFTYYTSLTGMNAASYGLQNTSNNVANMQSPGFKRRDVFYSSLGDGRCHNNLGSGVTIGGSNTNFSEGKAITTGKGSDLAIKGQGFFIVRLKNNELVYTRDGEFHFNQEGFLADRRSGGLVQGYNQYGNLAPIQQNGPKTALGKATRFVDLAGDFVLIEKKKEDGPVPPDPSPFPPSKYENIKFNLEPIYDAKGKQHKVSVEFKALPSAIKQDSFDGLEWEIASLTIDSENVNFSPQTIKFNSQSDGSALEGNNTIEFTLAQAQTVTLKFGSYMDSKDKSVHLTKQDSSISTSSVNVYNQDGYGEGTQISFSFDENGQIAYNYDNGQSIDGIHVALAKFDDLEHMLVEANDNLFRSKTDDGCHIGRANQHGFGSIQPQSLESSNVDSTTEFANIVVLQRMFQACSQIMDIDKQLLEELYKK